MKDPLSAFQVRHPVRHTTQAKKAEKRVYTVNGQKLTIDQIWEHAKTITPDIKKSTIATRLGRGQRSMYHLCEAPRKTCIKLVHLNIQRKR